MTHKSIVIHTQTNMLTEKLLLPNCLYVQCWQQLLQTWRWPWSSIMLKHNTSRFLSNIQNNNIPTSNIASCYSNWTSNITEMIFGQPELPSNLSWQSRKLFTLLHTMKARAKPESIHLHKRRLQDREIKYLIKLLNWEINFKTLW